MSKPQNKQIQPDKQLIKKICVSLFTQYLNKQRLFHTLAVFSPQSGYSRNLFNKQQLQQLFKLKGQNDKVSTLQTVMNTFLPKGRLYEKTVDISIQTDDKQTIQNLQNKLAHIQYQYKQKAVDGLKSIEASQQRFIKYKKQLQQQIKRIRDFQVANIKMEQQQKSKLKIRQYEEQLELNYRNKMEKLRQRQAQVMSRVANKMKQVETYNYQARQKMLKDLELIKQRQEQLEKLKSQILQKERQLIKSM